MARSRVNGGFATQAALLYDAVAAVVSGKVRGFNSTLGKLRNG